jgi:hypothetical protein
MGGKCVVFLQQNLLRIFDQSAINEIMQINGLQCKRIWMPAEGICRWLRLRAFW